MIKNYNKNLLLKKFLSEEIFGGQFDLWKFFNKGRNLDDLEQPKHGKQIGAIIDKTCNWKSQIIFMQKTY